MSSDGALSQIHRWLRSHLNVFPSMVDESRKGFMGSEEWQDKSTMPLVRDIISGLLIAIVVNYYWVSHKSRRRHRYADTCTVGFNVGLDSKVSEVAVMEMRLEDGQGCTPNEPTCTSNDSYLSEVACDRPPYVFSHAIVITDLKGQRQWLWNEVGRVVRRTDTSFNAFTLLDCMMSQVIVGNQNTSDDIVDFIQSIKQQITLHSTLRDLKRVFLSVGLSADEIHLESLTATDTIMSLPHTTTVKTIRNLFKQTADMAYLSFGDTETFYRSLLSNGPLSSLRNISKLWATVSDLIESHDIVELANFLADVGATTIDWSEYSVEKTKSRLPIPSVGPFQYEACNTQFPSTSLKTATTAMTTTPTTKEDKKESTGNKQDQKLSISTPQPSSTSHHTEAISTLRTATTRPDVIPSQGNGSSHVVCHQDYTSSTVKAMHNVCITFENGFKRIAFIDRDSNHGIISASLVCSAGGVLRKSMKNVTFDNNNKLHFEPNNVTTLHIISPLNKPTNLLPYTIDVVEEDGIFTLGGDFPLHILNQEPDDLDESSQTALLFEQDVIPNLYTEEFVLPDRGIFDVDIELNAPICTIKGKPLPTMNQREEEWMRNEVEHLLANGLITPVPRTSNYSVPFIQKGKKKQMFVNFHQLNSITKTIGPDILTFKEASVNLQGTHLTTLDLSSVYQHLRLSEKSSEYTTFRTPDGFYKWNVLPNGLKNNSEHFSTFINSILGPHCEYVRVCLKDILIFSKSFEEHRSHVRKVLSTLKSYKLHINLEKCQFCSSSVKWMDHKLHTQGANLPLKISPSDSATDHIRNAVVPADKKELQRFIGSVAYISVFLDSYANIAYPLTSLLRRDAQFIWKHEQQRAFHSIVDLVKQGPELESIDITAPIKIVVSASENAIAASLHHKIDNTWRPIGFKSKVLDPVQRNETSTGKALRGLVFGLDSFSFYLRSDQTVLIETAHHELANMSQSDYLKNNTYNLSERIDLNQIRIVYNEQMSLDGCNG